MAEMKNKVRSKNALVSHLNKKINDEVTDLLDETTMNSEVRTLLLTHEELLKEKLEKISNTWEEIIESQTDENYEQEMESFLAFEFKIKRILKNIRSLIENYDRSQNAPSVQTINRTFNSNMAINKHVKLPDIKIKKFSGDPANWNTFIETFNATIDSQTNLADVEKMTYLCSLLKGEAEETVRGLKLSNDNYKTARELLEERFGDKQKQISSHMAKLLSLEPVTSSSDVVSLRRLYNTVETQVRCLVHLGEDSKNFSSLLSPALMSKLPTDLKLQISRKFGKEVWNIKSILEHLNSEIEAREKIDLQFEDNKNDFPGFSGAALHTGKSQNYRQHKTDCVFCNKSDHKSYKCSVISKPKTRREIVQQKKLCFLCLQPNHSVKYCIKRFSCFKCGGKHHVSICTSRDLDFDKNNDKTKTTAEQSKSTCDNCCKNNFYLNKEEGKNNHDDNMKDRPSVNYANASNNDTNKLLLSNSVLLPTARARVCSYDYEISKTLRILFDSGSQMTFISKRARDLLKLKTLSQRNIFIKTFGKNEKTENLDQVMFSIKSNSGENIEILAYVSDICLPLTSQNIEFAKNKYNHLSNIELSDKNPFNEDLEIDILIGADYFWNFMLDESIRGNDGPVAVKTKVGYVLSGAIGKSNSACSSNFIETHVMKIETRVRDENHDLRNTMKTFWRNESIGIEKFENKVFKDFAETVKFKEGKYEVNLPFVENHELLEDNYLLSKNRLKSLCKKLQENKVLLTEYNNIIQDQLEKGIIEHAPETHTIGKTHFLPHRHVIRPDKESTRIRIVFDASSKHHGPSLNECLYAGPTLTTDLFSVLLRFRVFNYAIVADVEKAFLQISIAEKDRDSVRFLWFSNISDIDFENFENNVFQEFRFRNVLFGLTSSPFLLSATFLKHFSQYYVHDKEFVQKLLNCLHVDDLNAGANTEKEALDFFVNSKEKFKEGGFNLRKFRSNSKKLENEIFKRYDEEISTEENILGIQWNKTSDIISFDLTNFCKNIPRTVTKRSLIKFMASIYDPLGLINPLIVSLKILFQDVCIDKYDWDEVLPESLCERFNKIVKEFHEVNVISFPRKYFTYDENDAIESIQLHGFCDASKRAYGCCIYIRVLYQSGKIIISLVSAKSRINSLNKTTIPRLELRGAVLLVKTMKNVFEDLSVVVTVNDVFYWTDSYIVFAWIHNKSKICKQFVQSRLDIIREMSISEKWRLVASKSNPADIISRGSLALSFISSTLWFSGAEFLTLPEIQWPFYSVGEKFSDRDILCEEYHKFSEEGDTCLASAASFTPSLNAYKSSITNTCISKIVDITRFASLTTLLRVSMKILFAVKYFLALINKDGIIQPTIQNAKKLWIADVQRTINKNEKCYLNLNLFTDTDGLLRCGGRIDYAKLPYDVKFPYLLTKTHDFSKLTVISSHLTVLHNGVRETLCQLRSEFWIIKARNYVRKLIHECLVCRRVENQPYKYPNEPPLPVQRLSCDPAFSYIGIDYAGPIYVRDIYSNNQRDSTNKAWIALITCASSRAVYLDVVKNCSGQQCVNLLRRFFSNFGTPKGVISDNGSAFISEIVQTFVTNRNVKWSFNIQAAPWTGGIFERLVKSVKRCLRKVLGLSKVTYDELLTILSEITNVLNNRPLTYVYDDLIEAVTPNHLIYGRKISCSNLETGNNDKHIMSDVELTECYGQVQQIIQHFWKRFLNEYVIELREKQKRLKHYKSFPQISTGDIVLIHDEKVPRIKWKIGRVKELIYSGDDNIRAASLEIVHGERHYHIKRPVNKLYPLEVSREKAPQPIDITDSDVTSWISSVKC